MSHWKQVRFVLPPLRKIGMVKKLTARVATRNLLISPLRSGAIALLLKMVLVSLLCPGYSLVIEDVRVTEGAFFEGLA